MQDEGETTDFIYWHLISFLFKFFTVVAQFTGYVLARRIERLQKPTGENPNNQFSFLGGSDVSVIPLVKPISFPSFPKSFIDPNWDSNFLILSSKAFKSILA